MANTVGLDVPATLYGATVSIANTEHQGYAFAISGGSGTATIVYQLMRGIIAGNFVFWYATIVDTLAVEYTGGGGTPTSIKWIKRK